MIPFERAREIILECSAALPVETVPLAEIADRYLAQGVVAPFDLPNFDNSAVDGYGVIVADLAIRPATLKLLETVRAGESPTMTIMAGTCVKVMTGALLHSSVEAVVMKEECEERDGQVAIRASTIKGENIRRRGVEVRAGTEVVPAGTRVTPPVIGVLAALGMAEAAMHSRPRIAILVTGDELAMPGQPLGKGMRFDSNSGALLSMCRKMGLEVISLRRVSDNLPGLRSELESLLSTSDVVITVGGASVGEFDFVKQAMSALGVQIHFTQVAMKPGKPNVFGTKSHKLVFGLPGNPVSALVSFQVLVKPALRKMMGAANPISPPLSAISGAELRKSEGRMEFVRARSQTLDGKLTVVPVAAQESHMLSGLAEADCLIHFPAEQEMIRAGDVVKIERLTWDS